MESIPAKELFIIFSNTVFFKLSLRCYLCALELREKMKHLSEEWKRDTGWCGDLYLNIGINEGYEFFRQYSRMHPPEKS